MNNVNDKSNNDIAFDLVVLVVIFVIGVWAGYEGRITYVMQQEAEKDKKDLCVTMYKQSPVETMADSYCDEFFTVLRSKQ